MNHVEEDDEAAAEDRVPFLPSSSWQGTKLGYYFGTGDRGTGYYWDHMLQLLDLCSR
jgi:hypothetical protein